MGGLRFISCWREILSVRFSTVRLQTPITDDGQIEYKDGTYATKEQMAIDIVNFLEWAAEPELEWRKKMGVRTMIFLVILLVILVIAKKMIWKKVK